MSLKEIIGQEVVEAAAKIGLNLDLPKKSAEQKRIENAFDFLCNASVPGDGYAIQDAAGKLVLAIIDKEDTAEAVAGLADAIERYGSRSAWGIL